MTDAPSPLDRLREARAGLMDQLRQLDQQRESIKRALVQLAPVIEGLEGAPPVQIDLQHALASPARLVVGPMPDMSEPSGNTRAAIMQVLTLAEREMETNEIVRAVQDLGVESQPATIRSLLSKMAETGQIDRPRRGLYRQVSPERHVVQRSADVVHVIGGKRYAVVTKPTPQQFMEMPPHPEDESEPDHEPGPNDVEYAQWVERQRQAHHEEQAHREENEQ